MGTTEELEQKYGLLFPHLNERQQHLVAAVDAQQLGRGDVARISRLTGFSRPTIYRAVESLTQPPLPVERVRHSGAFSHITMNWRGLPLVSYQIIVNLIGATTTQAGLRVQADFDTDFYPTKVKVTDKQLATVDLHPHRFHGEWNYTIKHQVISV
jgi:Rhodopirellula transposase DDE domain